MAYKVYTQHPPIPEKVVSEAGDVVFTGRDIQSGQQVFRKYGLMQHGTIFGHGAYLGPDFTADYLHRASQAMLAFYAGGSGAEATPAVRQTVIDDLKRNTWNPQTRTITYSPDKSMPIRPWSSTTRAGSGPRPAGRAQKTPDRRPAGDSGPDQLLLLGRVGLHDEAARRRTTPTRTTGPPSRRPATRRRGTRCCGAP